MNIYDLFLPIGPDCRCALYLQRIGLRYSAFPLDWQLDYSLSTVLHLFQNGFKDFFIEIEAKGIADVSGKLWVEDKLNHITNIHHFSSDDGLLYGQQKFLDIMRKRWNKLDGLLKNINDCCLVMSRKVSVDEMENFLLEFSLLYPCLTVNLVNMNFDDCMRPHDIDESIFIVKDNLMITEYNFNNKMDILTGKEYIWPGDNMAWENILCKYDLRSRFMFIKDNIANRNIVIFGAGKRCKELLKMLDIYNISGIAVTQNNENPKYVLGYPVYEIEHYAKESAVVVSMANKDDVCETVNILSKKGYHNLFLYNRYRQIVSVANN